MMREGLPMRMAGAVLGSILALASCGEGDGSAEDPAPSSGNDLSAASTPSSVSTSTAVSTASTTPPSSAPNSTSLETIPDNEVSYEVRVERARELGFGPPVERLFADIEATSRDVAFAGPLIVDASRGVVSVCLALPLDLGGEFPTCGAGPLRTTLQPEEVVSADVEDVGSLDEFTFYELGGLAVGGRAAYEDGVLVLSDAELREGGDQGPPATTLFEPSADSTRGGYPPADLDALCVLMRRTDTPDDGRTIGYCEVIDPQRSILLDLAVVPPPEAIERFVEATGVPVIIQKIGADI
ncbi:MAG: hypothetical protein M3440_08300 [Chloroflexota bacterium]|nr:hypothetical protein [Chloroflexota bacterium]